MTSFRFTTSEGIQTSETSLRLDFGGIQLHGIVFPAAITWANSQGLLQGGLQGIVNFMGQSLENLRATNIIVRGKLSKVTTTGDPDLWTYAATLNFCYDLSTPSLQHIGHVRKEDHTVWRTYMPVGFLWRTKMQPLFFMKTCETLVLCPRCLHAEYIGKALADRR